VLPQLPRLGYVDVPGGESPLSPIQVLPMPRGYRLDYLSWIEQTDLERSPKFFYFRVDIRGIHRLYWV